MMLVEGAKNRIAVGEDDDSKSTNTASSVTSKLNAGKKKGKGKKKAAEEDTSETPTTPVDTGNFLDLLEGTGMSAPEVNPITTAVGGGLLDLLGGAFDAPVPMQQQQNQQPPMMGGGDLLG